MIPPFQVEGQQYHPSRECKAQQNIVKGRSYDVHDAEPQDNCAYQLFVNQ